MKLAPLDFFNGAPMAQKGLRRCYWCAKEKAYGAGHAPLGFSNGAPMAQWRSPAHPTPTHISRLDPRQAGRLASNGGRPMTMLREMNRVALELQRDLPWADANDRRRALDDLYPLIANLRVLANDLEAMNGKEAA